jgi:hypothetical protein
LGNEFIEFLPSALREFVHVQAGKHVDGGFGGDLDVVVFAGNIEVMNGVAVEIAVNRDFRARVDLQVESEAVLAHVGAGLQADLHDAFADGGLIGERGDVANEVSHVVGRECADDVPEEVSRLRRSACCALGTQPLRAGLTSAAPPALTRRGLGSIGAGSRGDAPLERVRDDGDGADVEKPPGSPTRAPLLVVLRAGMKASAIRASPMRAVAPRAMVA